MARSACLFVVVCFRSSGDGASEKERRLFMPVYAGERLADWAGRVERAHSETFGDVVTVDFVLDPALAPLEVPLECDRPADLQLRGLSVVTAVVSIGSLPQATAQPAASETAAALPQASARVTGSSSCGSLSRPVCVKCNAVAAFGARRRIPMRRLSFRDKRVNAKFTREGERISAEEVARDGRCREILALLTAAPTASPAAALVPDSPAPHQDNERLDISDTVELLEAARAAERALTVQGPQQALAMLRGLKLIENRSWPIASGWYALHVGGARGSAWGREAAARHADLPQDESCVPGVPFGAIVGLLHIAEGRSVAECGSNFWARGPICHVVSKAVQLVRPIPHRGAQGLWHMLPGARQELLARAAEGQLVRHELSALMD